MKKSCFCLSVVAVLLSYHSNSQTPGGVSVNMHLWLRPDAGVTYGSGSNIFSLLDQSPNAFLFNNFNSQPTIGVGANFNPVISFNGWQSLQLANGMFKGLTYSDLNVYLVSKTTEAGDRVLFHEDTGTGTDFVELKVPASTNSIAWHAGNSLNNNLTASNWGATYNAPYLWAFGNSITTTPSSTLLSSAKQDILRNGLRIATDNTFTAFTGNNKQLILGQDGFGVYYKGELSELVIYTGVMTNAQHNQVQSYLALKYGITLDQTSPQNYIASDGTTILWDANIAGVYNKYITGIARDDASGLNQLKSKSSNAPSDLIAIANGNFTTPVSFASNLQAFTWGHNGQVSFADIMSSPYTHASTLIARQIKRVWSIQKIGSPTTGNVIVEVDISRIPGTNDKNDILLLLDNDATFGNGTLGERAIVRTSSLDAGTKIYFTVPYSDIPTHGFFTIGSTNALTAPLLGPTPGGVAADLRLWLRADAGVTLSSGSNILTLLDQSPNAFLFTNFNSPPTHTMGTNFNPAISFAGWQDMQLTGGIFGGFVHTDLYVYVVSKSRMGDRILFHENTLTDFVELKVPSNSTSVSWRAANFPDNEIIASDWGANYSSPYLWSFGNSTTATSSSPNAKQDILRDGISIANDNTFTAFTGNNNTLYLGQDGLYAYYSGDVSELVIFTDVMTSEQHNRVKSYLAVKYGIMLDQDTPQNYLASDGSVIWDGTANAMYKYDIVGIGRDDASDLNQKQSASVNQRNILIIGNTAIAVTNATNTNKFITDKTFFTWGHNGRMLGKEPNQLSFTSTKGTPSDIKAWLARVWKAQKIGTNSVGTLKLRFNMSIIKDASTPPILGFNKLENVRLLVDNDGVFDAATTTTVAPTVYDNTTDIVDFDFDFTAATGFYFTIGTTNIIDTPLPVELLKFTATAPSQEGVLLKWTTATEENNDYFEIESSVDTKNWNVVAKIKGQGTTITSTNYQHIDDKPYSGTSYYRLRQVDFDGKWTYSGMEQVDIHNTIQLSISPNPSNGSQIVKVSLNVVSKAGTKLSLGVISLLGIELISKQVELTENENRTIEQQLDVQRLANGTYMIIAEYDGQVWQAKLVVSN